MGNVGQGSWATNNVIPGDWKPTVSTLIQLSGTLYPETYIRSYFSS